MMPSPTAAECDQECCHEDGDYHHNWLRNLRWDTRTSNIKDMMRHQRAPFAKLSELQVAQIKGLLGVIPQHHIASMYGVHPTTISNVATHKSWSHIKEASCL